MKRKITVNGIDPNRFCRHLLEGVIEIPKRCLLNHECHNCGFDQWLEETGKTVSRIPEMSVPGEESLAA